MGKLTVSNSEKDLWRNYYTEAMSLIGQECKVKMITKEKDIYNDYTIEVKTTVDADLLFENNPKPLLESFGWHLEDEELPFLAYLAIKDRDYEDMEVQKGMYIEIEGKEFQITRVRAEYITELVWIVTMVPRRYRTSESVTESSGYGYLNR